MGSVMQLPQVSPRLVLLLITLQNTLAVLEQVVIISTAPLMKSKYITPLSLPLRYSSTTTKARALSSAQPARHLPALPIIPPHVNIVYLETRPPVLLPLASGILAKGLASQFKIRAGMGSQEHLGPAAALIQQIRPGYR